MQVAILVYSMSSSDGHRCALWDCSEDEAVFEDEGGIDLAEMFPPGEELFPEVPAADVPMTPEPTAGVPPLVSTDSSDVPTPGAPELPVTSSESEPEPPADPKEAEPTACQRRLFEAPPKLKRLRAKTKVSTVVCPPVVPIVNLQFPSSHKEEFLSKHFWGKLTAGQQYNYVYEKLRGFYVSKVHEGTLRDEALETWSKLVGNRRQQEGRQAFKLMDADLKKQLTRGWGDLCEPPTYIAKLLSDMFLTTTGGNSRQTSSLRSSSVLLTWNLPDDFVDVSGVMSEGEPTASSEGEPTASLDEVVERLRGNSNVAKAWQQALDHGRSCMQAAGGDDIAICLEVCPQTLQLQKKIRLHVHAFIKSHGTPLAVRQVYKFDFAGGVRAHFATSLAGSSFTKGRSQWSGFLYCCLRQKKGTVFAEATKQPFKGFLVNPTWIMNLVQGNKLGIDCARQLLVQCVNASRHIKDLEAYDEEMEKLAVREMALDAARQLGGTLKAQKTYPKVQAFLNQFKKPRHRYKFLVLAGPSRVGKTAFARSLCEPGMEIVEVNCASGAEPNLKAYRFRKHGLILFDEVEAEQVAAQRKLFQAQASPVQLACSSTNCFSYEVFVWRKKLVLASNNWHSSMARLNAPDQDWILANSIVLDVLEPMWCE